MNMTFNGILVVSTILCVWVTSIVGAFTSTSIMAWSAGIVYVSYDTWLLLYVAWRTRKLHKETHPAHSAAKAHSLSVIIPARNEEAGIVETVANVLKQHTPAEQIIVVNDGSTDNTLRQLNQFYRFTAQANSVLQRASSHPNLFLLDKPNSGKADSMNQVLTHVSADLVLTLDADTLLEADATTHLLAEFSLDPRVGACCGILQPKTQGNALAKIFGAFQHFEYLRAFLARAAWAKNNALLLVSGAFAVYKTEHLRRVGGFSKDSKVEDYELIHRMYHYAFEHQLDWRITVCNRAMATTDAPATPSAFINQRKRWFAGFLQTQFQYRDMIANNAYGNVGSFMLPIKTVDTVQPLLGLFSLFLIAFLALTQHAIALQVVLLLAAKLCIDFLYYCWAVFHYHRWLNTPVSTQQWCCALACCLCEPLFFQPLRHFSALRGWLHLLNNQRGWNPTRNAAPILKETP